MRASATGRFQKGSSGNPGGAPKGYVSFRAMLQRRLAEVDSRDRSALQLICDAVVARAIRGDLAAAMWIAERTDGKVPAPVQVEGSSVVHVVPWLPAVADAVGSVDGGILPDGGAGALDSPVPDAPPPLADPPRPSG